MAYSVNQQEAAWEKTKGLCWYCGARLDRATTFSVDRIVPHAHGGTDELSNLVPACRRCNTLKGTGTVEDFASQVGARARARTTA